MGTTAAAAWLNSFFSGYDNAILTALHSIKCGVLTGLFKVITLLGEKGLLFFLLALICICFPKTRKFGVCLFGAVACGALITNVILKDMIARPRPFETSDIYGRWWNDVGAPFEDGFSFPSGHVTAAAAGAVAIRLMKGRKWTLPAIGWILLMMIARNYLMAHYPSDVLVAAIVGTASAFIAWWITKAIFAFLELNSRKKFCAACLEFSVPDVAGIPSRLGLTGERERPEKVQTRREPVRREPVRRADARATEEEEEDDIPAESRPGRESRFAAAVKKSVGRAAAKGGSSRGYVGKHEKR